MFNKKSQVTMFIIIILALILMFSLFFYFNNLSDLEVTQSNNLQNVRSSLNLYIEDCISEAVDLSILEIVLSGCNYYNEGNSYILNENQISLFYEFDSLTYPSLEQCQFNLDKLVEEKILMCTLIGFEQEIYSGYDFNLGEFVVDSQIIENQVLFDLSIPIEARKDNSGFSLNNYFFVKKSSLFNLYNWAVNFSDDYYLDEYYNFNYFADLNEMGIHIGIRDYYPHLKLFSLTEENEPLIFIFGHLLEYGVIV